MKNVEDKKIQKKKLSSEFLLFVIIPVIAQLSVAIGYYIGFSHPFFNKFTSYVYERSYSVGTEISCSIKSSATIFPTKEYGDENDYISVTPEITEGNSKIALKIDGDNLNFLTSTAVETGTSDAEKFTIITNSSTKLVAAMVISDEPSSINTIMIDKKTGYGIWTKASNSSFIPDLPNGQVYYLDCL